MLCWYFFLLTTPSVFPQFVEKVWKFFCYNINIELPFGVFFDIMLVTNPQCSCSPASPVMPTGALALASKVPAHDQGNGFLRLWGNLCMRCVPLHPPEALVSHLAVARNIKIPGKPILKCPGDLSVFLYCQNAAMSSSLV